MTYEENDSGQDLPEDPWNWVEMAGLAALATVVFIAVLVWAK